MWVEKITRKGDGLHSAKYLGHKGFHFTSNLGRGANLRGLRKGRRYSKKISPLIRNNGKDYASSSISSKEKEHARKNQGQLRNQGSI